MSSQASDGRTALVTGAGGFIGANLTRRLLAEGHAVHAAVRPGSEPWRLAGLDCPIHELDITDLEAVDALVGSILPEWVFHLAAHGAYSWQTDSTQVMRTNVMGSTHLIDAAISHGIGAFIQAGSSSEYGLKDSPPAETDPLEPATPYAVAKAAATLYAKARSIADDCHICTLRLYSAYGPWEEPNRLIPTLLSEAMRGGLPALVDPDTARDFVYVEDVCEAFIVAAEEVTLPRGSIFNIGSGRQTTIRDLVEVVEQLFPLEVEPEWGSYAPRVWDTNVWVSDSSHAARLLGWVARTPLSAGLSESAAWLRGEGSATGRYTPTPRA